MELRRYLSILRRRVLLIALTAIVAMSFAYGTADRSKTYTAYATLYVGANSFVTVAGNGATQPNVPADQSGGLSQLINTFAVMIKSAPIAEEAINLTSAPRSPGQLVGETFAVGIPETNLLKIAVTDGDPAVAQSLATGLAEAFVAKLGQLEPSNPTAEGGVPAAPVRIFERAKLPVVPAGTSATSNMVIAGLLGLLLSIGLILVVEYLDISVKTRDDAELRLELPVLAVVPMLVLDPSTTRRRAQSPQREELGLVRDA